MARSYGLALSWLVAASGVLSGCAGFAFSNRGVPMASVYASTTTNEQVTQNVLSTKSGEACASSILGIVTTGNASVPAAAQAAGISKIASVDGRFKNIVGVWSEYCVEVTGE